jgi:protein-arginine kinase activator protein McsA
LQETLDRLQLALREAIQREDFEAAARLRDEIKRKSE